MILKFKMAKFKGRKGFELPFKIIFSLIITGIFIIFGFFLFRLYFGGLISEEDKAVMSVNKLSQALIDSRYGDLYACSAFDLNLPKGYKLTATESEEGAFKYQRHRKGDRRFHNSVLSPKTHLCYRCLHKENYEKIGRY